jgi:uncharacterized protein
MSHRNEDMIRNNYEAFTRGDANPLVDSLSEDIQWHVSGQSPIAGDYFGKAEVLKFFARMMDLYQGTLRLQILDVMANDQHGAVLTNESAIYRGKTLEFQAVHVWDIDNGKFARFHVYNNDAYHKFWSEQSA